MDEQSDRCSKLGHQKTRVCNKSSKNLTVTKNIVYKELIRLMSYFNGSDPGITSISIKQLIH